MRSVVMDLNTKLAHMAGVNPSVETVGDGSNNIFGRMLRTVYHNFRLLSVHKRV
jgi:hypothetical protein